jgi:hypothetical protein
MESCHLFSRSSLTNLEVSLMISHCSLWRLENTVFVILTSSICRQCWSWRPYGIRRRSAAAWLLELWVFESRWGRGFSVVFVLCCVGSVLCDGLITCSQEFCLVWGHGGGSFGWGAALKARRLPVRLEFFIYLILPAVVRPCSRLRN